MSDHIFQEAYDRVRFRYTDPAWLALSPREIADAIYREIRILDRERMAPAQDGAAPVTAAAE